MQSEQPTTAVVLAGGEGRRLQPFTTVLPKPLMPLGDRSILEIVLRQLAAQGFEEVILAVGYLSELIEAFAGDGSRFGIKVRYAYEVSKLGTAGPLANIDSLPEPVLVMNGDILAEIDYRALIGRHLESGADATVAVVRRDESVDFGVIEVDQAGMLVDYVEKPVTSHILSTGIYVLAESAIARIPRGEPYDIPQLVRELGGAGRPVATYEMTGAWLDIGRKDDYEAALEEYQAHPERYNPGGAN